MDNTDDGLHIQKETSLKWYKHKVQMNFNL